MLSMKERRHVTAVAIFGFAFYALTWLVGLVFVARILFPALNPAAESEVIVRFYVEHRIPMMVGCVLLFFGTLTVIPWGTVIATMTRRMESSLPIWTYTQIVCLACVLFDFNMDAQFFALTAYRAGEQSADITRMLNDIAYFFLELPWPPFSLWLIAIAVPILRAKPKTATLPRWSAYLSLLGACVFLFAGFIMFFKSGPLAYNGFLAIYVTATDVGLWMIGMTVAIVQGLRRYSPADDLDAAVSHV